MISHCIKRFLFSFYFEFSQFTVVEGSHSKKEVQAATCYHQNHGVLPQIQAQVIHQKTRLNLQVSGQTCRNLLYSLVLTILDDSPENGVFLVD